MIFILAAKDPGKYLTVLTGIFSLGQLDLNQRVQESKSCALPLGDGPILLIHNMRNDVQAITHI